MGLMYKYIHDSRQHSLSVCAKTPPQATSKPDDPTHDLNLANSGPRSRKLLRLPLGLRSPAVWRFSPGPDGARKQKVWREHPFRYGLVPHPNPPPPPQKNISALSNGRPPDVVYQLIWRRRHRDAWIRSIGHRTLFVAAAQLTP